MHERGSRRNYSAIYTAPFFRVPINMISRGSDFSKRFSQGFPLVEGDCGRNSRFILTQQFCKPPQNSAAIDRRTQPPSLKG